MVAGWAGLVLFTMLLGQASCRVCASCLANCLATGQMLCVLISPLSPSKHKSFTSLVERSLLYGPCLSAVVGSRTVCTFLFLIWAVGVSSSCGGLLWSREWRFVPAVSISFPLFLESSRRCLLVGARIRAWLPPAGWAVFPAGVSGFLRRRPLRPLEVFFL
jgi:hypothetical protein